MQEYKNLFKNVKKYDEIDCGTHIVAIYSYDDGLKRSSKFSKSLEEVTCSKHSLGRANEEYKEWFILYDIVDGKKYTNSYWKNIDCGTSEEEVIKFIKNKN